MRPPPPCNTDSQFLPRSPRLAEDPGGGIPTAVVPGTTSNSTSLSRALLPKYADLDPFLYIVTGCREGSRILHVVPRQRLVSGISDGLKPGQEFLLWYPSLLVFARMYRYRVYILSLLCQTIRFHTQVVSVTTSASSPRDLTRFPFPALFHSTNSRLAELFRFRFPRFCFGCNGNRWDSFGRVQRPSFDKCSKVT
eukprot:501284-Rhodomonas_salina.2